MPWWSWAAAVAALALVAALVVWLLVITEGAYLGPGVVTALYDRVARRYDRIKEFDDGDEAHFLGEPVARYLATIDAGSASAPHVLDVAAGTGRFSLAVLQATEGSCHCVLLDRSLGMLRQAQAKLARTQWSEPVLLQHDAKPLPFAAGQFDVVACLEALEFMPDPKAVLSEVMRVVRPGGLVLVTRRIGRDARLMPGKVFSRAELSELLRGAGAGAVDVRPWQVDYDLAWALKSDHEGRTPASKSWMDALRCPHHDGPLAPVRASEGLAEVYCPRCGWRLRFAGGIWQRALS